MGMRALRLGICAVLVAALAGCATAPTGQRSTDASGGASSPAAGGKIKACLVGAAAGSGEDALNPAAREGLRRAANQFAIETQEAAATQADPKAAISSMVAAGCTLIVTVGAAQAAATEASAVANPGIKFVTTDAAAKNPQPNLKSLLFDPSQAAFLAGYLAASSSKTGTVAVFGGQKNAEVALYFNGFAGGVTRYNLAKGKDVRLLGWDVERQDGVFVSSAQPLVDIAAAKTTAEKLIAEGADVIFPVAGEAGSGALQAASASGGKVSIVWAPADGCRSQPDYCSVIGASVVKAVDAQVLQVIADIQAGNFNNSPAHGNLANEAVGVTISSQATAETKAELEALRKAVIDGSVTPPAAG